MTEMLFYWLCIMTAIVTGIVIGGLIAKLFGYDLNEPEYYEHKFKERKKCTSTKET